MFRDKCNLNDEITSAAYNKVEELELQFYFYGRYYSVKMNISEIKQPDENKLVNIV
jgi:hypothetical protein